MQIQQASFFEVDEIKLEIENLLSQKNYPCIGALQANKKNLITVGAYQEFGTGESSRKLFEDLLSYKAEQSKSNSPFLTFWASYPHRETLSESEFETKMWSELSHVAAHDTSQWDPLFSDNPADKKFCFSLGGSAFFVVGLHSQSSRIARRFSYPSMVFNLYEQFEIIDRMGQYESMVAINRKKDKALQGNVNPMVEKHGDHWEAIQFSGKQNDENWKCPFHRLMKKIKNVSNTQRAK